MKKLRKKKRTLFSPIISTSLALALGASTTIANPQFSYGTQGNSSANQNIDLVDAVKWEKVNDGVQLQTSNKTAISEIYFNFADGQSNATANLSGNSTRYSITMGALISADRKPILQLQSNHGIIVGDGGNGKLIFDFANGNRRANNDKQYSNSRIMRLDLSKIASSSYALQGNIEIGTESPRYVAGFANENTFEGIFGGKGMKGNIRIKRTGEGGSGNKSSFIFLDNANLEGNFTQEKVVSDGWNQSNKNSFIFDQGDLLGTIETQLGDTFVTYNQANKEIQSSINLLGGNLTYNFNPNITNLSSKVFTVDSSKTQVSGGNLIFNNISRVIAKGSPLAISPKTVNTPTDGNPNATTTYQYGSIQFIYDRALLNQSFEPIVLKGDIQATLGYVIFGFTNDSNFNGKRASFVKDAKHTKIYQIDGNITLDSGGISAFYDVQSNTFLGKIKFTEGHSLISTGYLFGVNNFHLGESNGGIKLPDLKAIDLRDSHIIFDDSVNLNGDLYQQTFPGNFQTSIRLNGDENQLYFKKELISKGGIYSAANNSIVITGEAEINGTTFAQWGTLNLFFGEIPNSTPTNFDEIQTNSRNNVTLNGVTGRDGNTNVIFATNGNVIIRKGNLALDGVDDSINDAVRIMDGGEDAVQNIIFYGNRTNKIEGNIRADRKGFSVKKINRIDFKNSGEIQGNLFSFGNTALNEVTFNGNGEIIGKIFGGVNAWCGNGTNKITFKNTGTIKGEIFAQAGRNLITFEQLGKIDGKIISETSSGGGHGYNTILLGKSGVRVSIGGASSSTITTNSRGINLFTKGTIIDTSSATPTINTDNISNTTIDVSVGTITANGTGNAQNIFYADSLIVNTNTIEVKDGNQNWYRRNIFISETIGEITADVINFNDAGWNTGITGGNFFVFKGTGTIKSSSSNDITFTGTKSGINTIALIGSKNASVNIGANATGTLKTQSGSTKIYFGDSNSDANTVYTFNGNIANENGETELKLYSEGVLNGITSKSNGTLKATFARNGAMLTLIKNGVYVFDSLDLSDDSNMRSVKFKNDHAVLKLGADGNGNLATTTGQVTNIIIDQSITTATINGNITTNGADARTNIVFEKPGQTLKGSSDITIQQLTATNGGQNQLSFIGGDANNASSVNYGLTGWEFNASGKGSKNIFAIAGKNSYIKLDLSGATITGDGTNSSTDFNIEGEGAKLELLNGNKYLTNTSGNVNFNFNKSGSLVGNISVNGINAQTKINIARGARASLLGVTTIGENKGNLIAKFTDETSILSLHSSRTRTAGQYTLSAIEGDERSIEFAGDNITLIVGSAGKTLITNAGQITRFILGQDTTTATFNGTIATDGSGGNAQKYATTIIQFSKNGQRLNFSNESGKLTAKSYGENRLEFANAGIYTLNGLSLNTTDVQGRNVLSILSQGITTLNLDDFNLEGIGKNIFAIDAENAILEFSGGFAKDGINTKTFDVDFNASGTFTTNINKTENNTTFNIGKDKAVNSTVRDVSVNGGNLVFNINGAGSSLDGKLTTQNGEMKLNFNKNGSFVGTLNVNGGQAAVLVKESQHATLSGNLTFNQGLLEIDLENNAKLLLSNQDAKAQIGSLNLKGRNEFVSQRNLASFEKIEGLNTTSTLSLIGRDEKRTTSNFRTMDIKILTGANLNFIVYTNAQANQSEATLGGKKVAHKVYSDRIVIHNALKPTLHNVKKIETTESITSPITHKIGVVFEDGTKLSEIGYIKGTGTERANIYTNIAVATVKNGDNGQSPVKFESVDTALGYTIVKTTLSANNQTNAQGEAQIDGGYTTYFIGEARSGGIIHSDVEAVSTALTFNHDLYLANFNSLNKRMGELRDNANAHGVWLRIFNGQFSNDFNLESKNNYTTIQAGYDYAFGFDGANNYLGIALSYAFSKGEVSSKAKDYMGQIRSLDSILSNAIEVALYNAYVADSGWYNDTIAKFSYIMSNFDIKNINTGRNESLDTNNTAFIFSNEFGYRFKLGKSNEWLIDPQFELGFGYFSKSDLSRVAGNAYLTAQADAITMLRTRLGSSFAYDFKNFIDHKDVSASLYLGLFYEFDHFESGHINFKDNRGTNQNVKNALKSDNRGVINIGTNVQANKNIRVYTDIQTSFGGKINTDYQINAGVRYSFGENTSYKPIAEEEKNNITPLKLEGANKLKAEENRRKQS